MKCENAVGFDYNELYFTLDLSSDYDLSKALELNKTLRNGQYNDVQLNFWINVSES